MAQGLYAFGAALCIVSTYWSIGFIAAIQLNYAVAPRFGSCASCDLAGRSGVVSQFEIGGR